MKPTIKQIFNLFKINSNHLVKKENMNRWINVIRQLQDYDYGRIFETYDRIQFEESRKPQPEKNPYYFLEAVRRNLMLEDHENLKHSPTPQCIKDILKGMANG